MIQDYMKALKDEGYINVDLMREFDKLRAARNRAAHMSSAETSDTDWDDALKTAIEILGVLDKINRPHLTKGDSKVEETGVAYQAAG